MLKNNTSKSPSSLVDNNTRTQLREVARTSPIHSIVDEAIGTERKGILKDTAVSFRKFPSEEDDTFHEKVSELRERYCNFLFHGTYHTSDNLQMKSAGSINTNSFEARAQGISRASAGSRGSREDHGMDLEAEMGIVGENLNRLTTTLATADLATRVAKVRTVWWLNGMTDG